jgi:nucleoid-associated protein YgaU
LTACVFLFLGYCIAYYWHPVELPEFTGDEPATEIVEETPAEPTDTVATVAAQGDATIAAAAKEYPQQEEGVYLIVGELGTEKMTAGKTLLNMALKYYKNKDLYTYICTMNGITNPDIVPLDMELRIPELKDKKTGLTPIEVAEAAKNQ